MLYACPTCGKRTKDRHCPAHKPKAWANSKRRTELPPDWPRRRAVVLDRDPVCTVCDSAVATEVHHAKGKHDHRIESLAGICKDCHKEETAKQSLAART